MIAPLLEKVSRHSLKWKLFRNVLRVIGPRTRTEVLADIFDEWWFGEKRLKDLSERVRWIFNASNVTTGVRFGWEREVVLDGGSYDNSGLAALDDATEACLVALNAGGLFKVGRYGMVPLLRDLMRANALLYRQSTAIRRQQMVERFRAWEQAVRAGQEPPAWGRQGVLFGLATTLEPAPEWSGGRPEFPDGDPDLRKKLALLPTSFDLFPPETCEQLIHRGWWLTGATLSTYHRDVLPAELPRWVELPKT